MKVHKDYMRYSVLYGNRRSLNQTSFRTSDQNLLDHMGRKSYQNNHAMINKINDMQDLWTAKAYPEHEQYTHLEMLRRMGGIKSRIAK